MLGNFYFQLSQCTFSNSIHKTNDLLSDELPSIDVKRLAVWYDKKNDVWTRYSRMFGFYSVEKFLVNDKPSYTSDHERGAYAIWLDENKNWCLGSSSFRGKKEWHCIFFAHGKGPSGGNDVDPTGSDYTWMYFSNGDWSFANHGFKIISADGNSIDHVSTLKKSPFYEYKIKAALLKALMSLIF